MEDKVEFSRKSIVIFAVVLFLAVLIGTCSWRAAEERRRDEETATAEGFARVIKSTFSGKTDLRVSNLSGRIDVTSIYHGMIFDSKLKASLPFSVDYFVDLSGLSLRDVRFDENSRTLFVEIPDVRIAEPNINLAQGTLGNMEGWWVSREASKVLVNRAAKLVTQRAAHDAAKTENIEKARAEARQRISALLQLPLEAAQEKLGKVNVVVRYPADAGRSDERWDVSRSIQDVLDEAAQHRVGGLK